MAKSASTIAEPEVVSESEETSSEQQSENSEFEDLSERQFSSEEESEDETSKKQTLKRLLEPFTKDQIIEFLKIAALSDPQLLTQITESDPTHRQIFIHGLGWDATDDQVRSVFAKFGEIEKCKVVTDKVTGKAKGFAFVLFKTRAGAKKALKDRQKKIGNRMTSCQLASAGPGPALDSAGRKIFVANVGSHVSPEGLRGFFAKFGQLEEGPLGIDTVTGKFKGFAIFVYKTAEGCKKALEEPVKVFDSCRLECRLCVDGLKNIKNQPRVAANTPASFDTDIGSTVNCNVGVNPGIYAANMNPAAFMMGQNPGFGLANPVMVPSLNQTGLATSVGANLQSIGLGGNYGINSVSPSAIGNNASQAALWGIGAYKGAQLGHSSVGSSEAVATPRPQSAGFGSTLQTFPSLYGR